MINYIIWCLFVLECFTMVLMAGSWFLCPYAPFGPLACSRSFGLWVFHGYLNTEPHRVFGAPGMVSKSPKWGYSPYKMA